MTMLPRRPIETERLILDPLTPAFAPALALEVERSREHLSRWLSWAPGNRLEDTLALARRAERAWMDGSAYHFVIVHGGTPAGLIALRRSRDLPSQGNIGYWIAGSAAGQGLMTEAAGAIVAFAFQSTGVNRVELRAHVENRASQRVAEKVGMLREGRLRGARTLAAAAPADAYLYGILDSDPRRDTAAEEGRPEGVAAVTEPDFSRGLVTAVAQDQADGAVLMVAHMNEEAYRRTRETGRAWFWSRSRERLWEKGETSGNHLVVNSVTLDCDGDAVLLRVVPAGPACHTGARSCFHNAV